MAFKLKRTVTIGLGGTGLKAVLNMKKKLIENYGEIPPMMKFLVIDTADEESLKTRDGEDIKLDGGEFLKLQVKNPKTAIKTTLEVKKWIPENVPNFSLTSGAKQVRPLGRLAAFVNVPLLEAKIDSIMDSVRDFSTGRISDKYEIISENLIVNIVFSVSGGTGSGTYLDIVSLVRKNWEDTDKLIGYVLLPDIFVGKPATANVEPNAYGALREISYFFTQIPAAKYSYKLGGKTRNLDSGLFNAVYLINKTNKSGAVYNNLDDLTEFLGLGMYLQSSSTGKSAGDIIDNLEAIQSQGKPWFGKPTSFSSFGISELVFRSDWFIDLYAKGIALNVLQKSFIGGDASGVNDFTDNYIQSVGIKEHLADDVIDSIIEPGSFRKFPLPPDFKKDSMQQSIQKKKSHLLSVEKKLKDTAKANLTRFEKEKVESIKNKITELLGKPQGLDFTRNFLNCFIGRLNEFKEEMINERDKFTATKEDISNHYNPIEQDAEKAAKKIFGAKDAMGSILKRYKALVDQETNTILEIERREKAITFFSTLINLTDEWNDKLETFACYFDVLTQEFSQELQAKRNEKRELKPFVIELKPETLTDDIPEVQADDFYKWLKEEKHIEVIDLANYRIEEVKNILLEYGYSHKEVKEIKAKRLEDILRDMTTESRNKIIKDLDKMAAPLWQYDQGYVTENRKTENLYLFGVENPEDTIFKPEVLKTQIVSTFVPAIIGTGDPIRVTCFKVEASVPAFIVKNVSHYREKYLSNDYGFSFHLDRNWKNDLPKLFPGTDEEENRKWWSLGLANPFNLIYKSGAWYYLISKKYGKKIDDYKIKLAQGRLEALKVLLENKDYIEELSECIEKLAYELDNQQVIHNLKEFGDNLLVNAKKQTDKDIRNLVELEIGDIENYINSITKM